MGNRSCKTLENTICCDEVILEYLLSRTTFSRKKITDLHANLLHDCPSGKISPAKFVAIFKEFFSTGNAEQFNAAALFRTLDADRSGSIDFTELVLALHLEATGSIEERLRWTFRMYDEDDDGSLSIKEMRRAVTRMYRMMGSDCQDGEDGKEWAAEMFAMMDADSDGAVTEDEFVAACFLHRELMNVLAPKATKRNQYEMEE